MGLLMQLSRKKEFGTKHCQYIQDIWYILRSSYGMSRCLRHARVECVYSLRKSRSQFHRSMVHKRIRPRWEVHPTGCCSKYTKACWSSWLQWRFILWIGSHNIGVGKIISAIGISLRLWHLFWLWQRKWARFKSGSRGSFRASSFSLNSNDYWLQIDIDKVLAASTNNLAGGLLISILIWGHYIKASILVLCGRKLTNDTICWPHPSQSTRLATASPKSGFFDVFSMRDCGIFGVSRSIWQA